MPSRNNQMLDFCAFYWFIFSVHVMRDRSKNNLAIDVIGFRRVRWGGP